MFMEDLKTSDDLKTGNNFKIFKPGKLPTRPRIYALTGPSAAHTRPGPTLKVPVTHHTKPLLHILDEPSDTYYLVDMGAEVSIIPPKPPGLSLVAANGTPIKSYGIQTIVLKINCSC